jgi:NAD-dependent SIR2 family protein deacetylase
VRFLEKGTDVPDDLIRAVNEGSVTFLCGAGVSFRVGLPSFNALTKKVYERLGESWEDEPAERKAIEAEQYDRALRSLEKRTHLPKTQSRVRNAVAELLAAPDCALPDHLALLRLSRDPDGRPKILTTNFDTLFERARLRPDFLEHQAIAERPFRVQVANATTASSIFTGGLATPSSTSSRAISF